MKSGMCEKNVHTDDTMFGWLSSVLTLMDPNPFSPTYGCFDREYWLYRGKDFPSGMQQCFVLVPALAYIGQAGERSAGNPRLREAVLAGLSFLEHITRRDGSLDDYFPNERALGAAAHVLFFASEALLALGEQPDAFPCLARMAQFVSHADEVGQLANHHAAVAAALVGYARLCKRPFGPEVQAAVGKVVEMQHREGWFPEYGGADPGYQTMTIAYLAYVWSHVSSMKTLAALQRAVHFCRVFLTEDCAFGGELGSRGTTHLNGFGFELLRGHAQGAAELADAAYRCHLKEESFLHDSRFIGAYAGWAMLARRARESTSNSELPAFEAGTEEEEIFFPEAGLVRTPAGDHGELTCFMALARGGVVKVYRGCELVYAEAGLLLETDQGLLHTQGLSTFSREGKSFVVKGSFQSFGGMIFSPLKFMASRLVFLTCGSRLRDTIRRFVQRRLVSGKSFHGLVFEKRITPDEQGVHIQLEIRCTGKVAPNIRRAILSPDFNAKTTATGYTFHQTRFLEFVEMEDIVAHDFEHFYVHEKRISM